MQPGEQPPRRLRILIEQLALLPNGQKLGEYAAALDRWMREWATYAARKDLPEAERTRAIWVLTSMRRDFNALVAEARAAGPGAGGPSELDVGTALDRLDRAGVSAISQALGVPFEPHFRPLFEVKAVEYLEQDELWDDIARRAGFAPAAEVEPQEQRSVVVLTYTGSILLLSAPFERKIRRQYVYQSIYANNLPKEGVLALLDPIVHHSPVRATRFTTSAVRKLAVSPDMRFEVHRATFARLHQTLGFAHTPPALQLRQASAQMDVDALKALARRGGPAGAPAMPPSGPGDAAGPGVPGPHRPRGIDNTVVSGTPAGAASAQQPAPRPSFPEPHAPGGAPAEEAPAVPEPGLPSVFVQVLHRERQRSQAKEQEEVARAELRGLLARLVDGGAERDHALEAEILGQVLHLQQLAADRGEVPLQPQSLAKLETENNDVCVPIQGGLNVGKVSGGMTFVPGASFAGQQILRGAPIAILARDASLYAVLGSVRAWVSKA